MSINIKKQLEYTRVEVGENVFHIKPFPAFTAAKLSGDLSSLLAPLLGGVASVVPDKAFENEATVDDVLSSVEDMDINDALPAISNAFSGISGDKLEALMKKLLVVYKNVSIDDETADGGATLLTYDLANEVFCGDVQDMYILCYHVIKINFNGFFKKVGNLFGKRKEPTEETQTSNPMAPLM